MLKIDLDVPDHTTLSRRGKTVQVHLPKQARGALHLAVGAERGEIQAAVLTEAGVHDAEAVPDLLAQIERPLASAAGDGAYDLTNVYEALTTYSPKCRSTFRHAEELRSNSTAIPRRRRCRAMRTCVSRFAGAMAAPSGSASGC